MVNIVPCSLRPTPLFSQAEIKNMMDMEDEQRQTNPMEVEHKQMYANAITVAVQRRKTHDAVRLQDKEVYVVLPIDIFYRRRFHR